MGAGNVSLFFSEIDAVEDEVLFGDNGVDDTSEQDFTNAMFKFEVTGIDMNRFVQDHNLDDGAFSSDGDDVSQLCQGPWSVC